MLPWASCTRRAPLKRRGGTKIGIIHYFAGGIHWQSPLRHGTMRDVWMIPIFVPPRLLRGARRVQEAHGSMAAQDSRSAHFLSALAQGERIIWAYDEQELIFVFTRSLPFESMLAAVR